ncbi:hypothetical protein A2755_01420 [Candidatus Wolfebacteria bacterium RIFCSPHIGHO2_01_FULL_48_22]|uniref:HD domain-containing protein n=2 Tax=Candidatus Wolfeibacteriota TaxID=1752735 RepID=A0A1F8DXC0_9BACT|nr:MAG: hypothetical protein A2755_01420 [Candidatus Wolfebacteria bacterium RIFCSPHIGHO2_01_FULL_48_22]OGM93892.1 MAG: hypothetical protein A2935_03365 [Candidatus Wolfebacteria bacterium RIFCSPLOWO2_01_FULL_47_17b]
MKNFSIPQEVADISKTLAEAGFEAYAVGGCVRDLLLGRKPADWDIATNAKPEEIQKLFPDSVYENAFGTVAVKTGLDDETLALVEVTTYRVESSYSDYRRPDAVVFAKTIEEDLSRRDFTINAIAFRPKGIVDLYGGQDDVKKKIIRAVGNANDRFNEDALRMLRAVRLTAQLDFKIEESTYDAIRTNVDLLKHISIERIRDEFEKLIMTPRAGWGLELLHETGLLKHIIPELLEGVGVGQNKHHIYTVWEHNKRALEYAVEKGYPLEIRLGALLHDVGKPRTKAGDGINSTFYAHEIVGGMMTKKIMERLKFPKKIADHVTHLVRFHLFYYNVGDVTEAGVRRFLKRVGSENVDDLLKIREADRIGSGVPKAFPYKLRHLLFMIDKVKKDAIDTRMLEIDGTEIMEELGLNPGPKVGWIMSVLLEEVLDDSKKNSKEKLFERARELDAMSDAELIKLQKKAKDRKEEFEQGVEEEIKKRYRVS